jgi:hypothetical protein
MSDEAFRPPGDCPVCGEFVPRKAMSCAGCGASRDSGWNEEASVSGLDLPDDEEFDYDDFVAREFGQGQPKKPDRRRFWTVVGLVLILAMAASLLAVFRFH